MATIEVEVKIRVADKRTAARRIVEAGGKLLHPREFEDNRLYDFPDRGLMRRGAMLRIRILERGVLLTYKDRPRTEAGVKMRDEIETSMARSEAQSLSAIVERLGLRAHFRYEKYRTTWEIEGALVTLDETPIGDYLEIEGDRAAIDAVASRLGHGPGDYIASSYRDLYLRKRELESGPEDRMVFQA